MSRAGLNYERLLRNGKKFRPEAKAMVDGNIGSILLDSGAVDRSFITYDFVNKYNLLKHKLAY